MKRQKPENIVGILRGTRAFVLVEILIAVAILSIVLISVISGVSRSIYAMSGSKYTTRAMLIARTKMNEFILAYMRGTDLKDERIEGYEGFTYSRVTKRFEHPMLGPLPAYETEIIINWKEEKKARSYKVSYIYQGK